MRNVYLCVLALCVAGTLGAQVTLNPGDLIVTYNDVAATANHATVKIDPNTSAVTTILTTSQTAAATGNWIEMANNNQDFWIAFNAVAPSPAEIWVIDALGGVKSRSTMAFTGSTTQFRADGFHFTNDGGITWSIIGGTPSVTNYLVKTDLSFGLLDTLNGTTALVGTSLGHTPTENGKYATSSQTTVAGGGAVQEVDPATKTITRTVSGMALCNTVDFNKGDGFVYATEFGFPGNTTAQAGSLP